MRLADYRPRKRRTRTATAIGSCTIALLATLLVAGSAQSATPTTVLLGTAGQFAVLAGSGMTNTGVSTISGDVGSSPTSTETGFTLCPAADCVALTGTNHVAANPNDSTTQGAKAALTTAYNDAAGRSATSIPTELAGQTLVAGVYTAPSGTFGMSGTLVLDGENNRDAVFIFQTGSTLITAGAANITLTRGAQACNIFWKVGSAATLGGGSTMRGTIMAHDDISLGNGVTVDGRLLAGEQGSGAGAVTLIHDTIIRPSTCLSQRAADEAAAAAEAEAAASKAAADQAAAVVAAAAAQAAAADLAAKAAAAAQVVAAQTAATQLAAAKAAAAKAAAAKVAAAKVLAAKKVVAAKKVAAAKKVVAAKGATSTQRTKARPARTHAGFTG